MKITRFVLNFLGTIIITIVFFYILFLIFSKLNISEAVSFKIYIHIPILVQLIFTTIVCFNKLEFNIIKNIFISTLIFGIICVFYNLNFIDINYSDENLPYVIIFYLAVEEIIFQIYLVILISIFAILKKIKKRYIIYNFMILIPIPFSLEVWLLYIFNPVLIFILTSIVDGDLLIEDKKD